MRTCKEAHYLIHANDHHGHGFFPLVCFFLLLNHLYEDLPGAVRVAESGAADDEVEGAGLYEPYGTVGSVEIPAVVWQPPPDIASIRAKIFLYRSQ